MKECFKCNGALPLSEFYRHPDMPDGYLNKCKPCARKDARENRAAKRDYYNEYDRNRKRGQSVEASKRRHRDRYLARIAVRNALVRGKLARQPCSICGDHKSQAHHLDYTRRLDVVWLCRTHHGEAHRIETPVPHLTNLQITPSRAL